MSIRNGLHGLLYYLLLLIIAASQPIMFQLAACLLALMQIVLTPNPDVHCVVVAGITGGRGGGGVRACMHAIPGSNSTYGRR